MFEKTERGDANRRTLAPLGPPDQLVSAWQAGSMNDAPSPEAADRLRANMAIAQAIGLKGTPTFIWRKPDGTEGRIDGIPTSIDAMVSSAGG